MKKDDRNAETGEILQAQCWEDGDTLRRALDVQSGETVVSIASAGDNTLALLLDDPANVVAVDPSPAQIACCQLKAASFLCLGYGEILELNGSRSSNQRPSLLSEVLKETSAETATLWQTIGNDGVTGMGGVGVFERQWEGFRRKRLPFAAGKAKIDALFSPGPETARAEFYDRSWNTRRWRQLFRGGFARSLAAIDAGTSESPRIDSEVMGSFQNRLRRQMVELDPGKNPWLHWLLRGDHGDTLPPWLQARNFGTIRDRLKRIEWQGRSLEAALGTLPAGSVGRFNLGGMFETASEAAYQHLLKSIIRVARPGARLVYWNTLVSRSRPESLRDQIRPMTDLAEKLTATDRTLFGQKLIIEEIV